MLNLQKVHNTVTEQFQNHFNDNSHESIESTPQIFHNKVTNEEVKENIMKLNKSRASGVHQISAEMIKYGPLQLRSIITTVFNEYIQNNIDIEIRFGLLKAIQKPNKPKGTVTNPRPLTLLSSIRKYYQTLYSAELQIRLKDIPQAQSAYRNKSSTGDIIWAY